MTDEEFQVGELVQIRHGRTIGPGRVGKVLDIDDHGLRLVRFNPRSGLLPLWYGPDELKTPPPLIALADCAYEDSVFDE